MVSEHLKDYRYIKSLISNDKNGSEYTIDPLLSDEMHACHLQNQGQPREKEY